MKNYQSKAITLLFLSVTLSQYSFDPGEGAIATNFFYLSILSILTPGDLCVGLR